MSGLERVSAAQRFRMQIVAERELLRFAGNHAAWHKHVHDVELDPMQVLKMQAMDESPNSVDVSCRRTGKTATKELYLLELLATHADQELGIVAPREAQAQVNLRYHTEAIQRSQILTAYLGYRNGRRQMNETRYQLANRSVAQAYGIMAQVDGGDMTAASLEEVDDMPADRLYSRFLLMLASSRRLGAAKESKNEPSIRVTGVFKGADTLQGLIDAGVYRLLPTVDAYLGIEMGILHQTFVEQMRDELTAEEYIRQMLCKNVASRNLIWTEHVRKAMTTALAAGIELAEPVPGGAYRKRGMVAFGYDAGGHGERPESSQHALVVVELVDGWWCFPFVKVWPAGADEERVRADLLSLWAYFDPEAAIGDAYGVGMLTALCDDLYRRGLTRTDRRAVGDGESTASTWPDWPFAPMRFEGMVKHQMAQAVAKIFAASRAVIPYLDDHDLAAADTADLRLFVRQLTNVVPRPSKAAYPSYRMVNAKTGDDLFDAAMAAVWALYTQGAVMAAPVILSSSRNRTHLIEGHANVAAR